MPFIKLTKASLANLTGQLPGKNFRGVDFVDGVSTQDLPLAIADKFAAQLEGVLLCEADGEEIGPAGSFYRKETIIPTPVVPRAPSVYPVASETVIKTIVPDQRGIYFLTAEDNGLFLDAPANRIAIAVTNDLPASFQVAIRTSGASEDSPARLGGFTKDVLINAAGVDAGENGSVFELPVRFGIVGLMRFPDGSFQITGQFTAPNAI